jgi:hypothetical protein
MNAEGWMRSSAFDLATVAAPVSGWARYQPAWNGYL